MSTYPEGLPMFYNCNQNCSKCLMYCQKFSQYTYISSRILLLHPYNTLCNQVQVPRSKLQQCYIVLKNYVYELIIKKFNKRKKDYNKEVLK